MKTLKTIVAALALVSASQASAQLFDSGPFGAGQFTNHASIGQSAGMAGLAAGAAGFNHENQVAVECVSQYGVSKAGAACVAGRLTADELNKCFTDGFGGRGCFGENNTLVALIHANVEAAARESGDLNQAIRVLTGISVGDIEEEGIFGGDNSFFNCPFGGC